MPSIPGNISNGGAGKTETNDLTCGLVMPISTIDGCGAEHWAEVKSIIVEAVETISEFRFQVKLVSEDDAIGIIQKRIVQNVYHSDVVVCDVSGKNPNVMFELGMRLAFDKPTVIVKDDKTDYSFDTGIIEHVPYPRDLRFARIVDFKKAVADKVLNTHKAAAADPDHSTFLKSFGKFQVAALSETRVSSERLVISMLEEMQSDIQSLKRRPRERESTDKLGDLDHFGEGIARVAAAVRKFKEREKKAEGTPSLVATRDVYDYVSSEITAPRYFESPKEFIKAVDIVVKNMS